MSDYLMFKRFLSQAILRYKITDEYYNNKFHDDDLFLDEQRQISLIDNNTLKKHYDDSTNLEDIDNSSLDMYLSDYYEISFKTNIPPRLSLRGDEPNSIVDHSNNIEYTFCDPTDRYIVFILVKLFNKFKDNICSDFRRRFSLIHRSSVQRRINAEETIGGRKKPD